MPGEQQQEEEQEEQFDAGKKPTKHVRETQSGKGTVPKMSII